jgi:hypothetical protein
MAHLAQRAGISPRLFAQKAAGGSRGVSRTVIVSRPGAGKAAGEDPTSRGRPCPRKSSPPSAGGQSSEMPRRCLSDPLNGPTGRRSHVPSACARYGLSTRFSRARGRARGCASNVPAFAIGRYAGALT